MTPLRVYIAAPLSAARQACDYAAALSSAGWLVVSRWHRIALSSGDTIDPAGDTPRAAILAANIRDLESADMVFAYTAFGTPRATYCEIGWALALATPVVWLHADGGAGRNIFDAHELVYRVTTIEDALTRITEQEKAR